MTEHYQDPLAVAEEFAKLRAELEAASESYRILNKAFAANVAACAWMHYDKTLGLTLGQSLTTDGVQALRKQRDDLLALLRIAGTCGVCSSRSYMRCPVVHESMKPEYSGLFPKDAKRGEG